MVSGWKSGQRQAGPEADSRRLCTLARRCGAVERCLRTVQSKPTAKSLPRPLRLEAGADDRHGLNSMPRRRRSRLWGTGPVRGFPARSPQPQARLVGAHGSGASARGPRHLHSALTHCQPRLEPPATQPPPSEDSVSKGAAPRLLASADSHGPLCQGSIRLVTGLLGGHCRVHPVQLGRGGPRGACESPRVPRAHLCKNYILHFLSPTDQTLTLAVPSQICGRTAFWDGLKGPSHRLAWLTWTGLVPRGSRKTRGTADSVLSVFGSCCDIRPLISPGTLPGTLSPSASHCLATASRTRWTLGPRAGCFVPATPLRPSFRALTSGPRA